MKFFSLVIALIGFALPALGDEDLVDQIKSDAEYILDHIESFSGSESQLNSIASQTASAVDTLDNPEQNNRTCEEAKQVVFFENVKGLISGSVDPSILSEIETLLRYVCGGVGGNARYPNGNYVYYNGRWYYPNSNIAYYNGRWYYPNNVTAYYNSRWYYSNSNTAYYNGRWYYSNGITAYYNGRWYYPNSNTAYYNSRWYYPNNVTAYYNSRWYYPNGNQYSDSTPPGSDSLDRIMWLSQIDVHQCPPIGLPSSHQSFDDYRYIMSLAFLESALID